MSNSAATYTQLRDGAWGIRVAGKATVGQSVTVVKKSGESKVERVDKVLWSGADSKTKQIVSLCAIKSEGNGGRRGVCANCGSPCNPKYRRCLDCVDGGGNAHGGMSYYDRNGNFVLGDDD